MATDNPNYVISPLVEPEPVVVKDELAHLGSGLPFAANPTEFMTELRAIYGDTFLVDVFGYKLFCCFSAKGLENLYKLAEEDASFGLATFDLMSFKTPLEVFMDADLRLFYQLLTKERVDRYLMDIHEVVKLELTRWGKEGTLDLFDHIRTMEQRVGFRLWIGQEASSDRYWRRLKEQFDILDQESAFVDPRRTLHTIRNKKADERAAVDTIGSILKELWQNREGPARPMDSLQFLHSHFGSSPEEERLRKVQHNVINLNQGFLSNLYAALAWSLVHLLTRAEVRAEVDRERRQARQEHGPDYSSKLEALTQMAYMEQLLMESVRMAQRSITLRKVLKPVDFDDGQRRYRINPGVYITTFSSVTNTQTDELASFDPQHYQRNQLRPELVPEGKETVSTFGHGRHSCPAQRFSHLMHKVLLCQMLERLHLEPLFSHAQPSPRQVGGVARSAEPCMVRYRAIREPSGRH